MAHRCGRCWGGERSGMALAGLARVVRELGWHRCLAGDEVWDGTGVGTGVVKEERGMTPVT